MNLTITFLALFFALGTCNQKAAQEIHSYKIIYLASSRGFFLGFNIEGHTMSVQKVRGGKVFKRELTSGEKSEIGSILSNLNMNSGSYGNLEDLARDAAIPATLKIFKNRERHTYSFGHDNPPEGLSELVGMLMQLAQTFD